MTPGHADLRGISGPECDAIFRLLAGDPVDPVLTPVLQACLGPQEPGVVWLLAHCIDGVTWGRLDATRLTLSCGKHPDWPTPLPSQKNVLELRLFGSGGEALVWRDETAMGGFSGRLLTDAGPPAASDDALRPKGDVYLLAASRIQPRGACPDDFTVVAEANGRTQVVPLKLTGPEFDDQGYPAGLSVRHYFEQDEWSGCVRIAASRLVDLARVKRDVRLI